MWKDMVGGEEAEERITRHLLFSLPSYPKGGRQPAQAVTHTPLAAYLCVCTQTARRACRELCSTKAGCWRLPVLITTLFLCQKA